MIQRLKQLKKAPKLTEEQARVSYTRRNAKHAASYGKEHFESPERPGVHLARFALNKEGIVPSFTHVSRAVKSSQKALVEVAVSEQANNDIVGVSVDRELGDGNKDKYHIAFAPGNRAIITSIGEPGSPLGPADNPNEKLDYAQDALDDVITSRYKK